jgi:hypothetical protein
VARCFRHPRNHELPRANYGQVIPLHLAGR